MSHPHRDTCADGLAALRSHHCPSGTYFRDVDSHMVTHQQVHNFTLEVPGHLPSPTPSPVLGMSGECVTLSHRGDGCGREVTCRSVLLWRQQRTR